MGEWRQGLAALGCLSQTQCQNWLVCFSDSECIGHFSSRGRGPTLLPSASLLKGPFHPALPPFPEISVPWCFCGNDPGKMPLPPHLWFPMLLFPHLPCDLGQVVSLLWSLRPLTHKMQRLVLPQPLRICKKSSQGRVCHMLSGRLLWKEHLIRVSQEDSAYPKLL